MASLYDGLYEEVHALVTTENDLIANMANVGALLWARMKEKRHLNWCGFYRVVEGKEALVLGPFQGEVACVHIPFSKGVCGAAARERKTVIAPDVRLFPLYISCSGETLSEIVVPVFDGSHALIGVLDLDSVTLNSFDASDAKELERLMSVFALPKTEGKSHH